ncbi:hypothetical protein SASPL_130438 [Salvia splendens]|uniref:LOB domain-containing protein n=1 Tax=Salvia splendens TaxID=180675 RepID=A0A8X8ZJG0_SALSN|nr:LOB domain-containing protein 25-like [Salvia splendens]XP_042007861.1 LOB domain-containing protein 25-like [Salvia splendens]KAG6407447.1 hypothetical protein SASPL_130438 [Salvia splendens]
MRSRCAACKCLCRECTEDCPMEPYFPADDPKKFSNVHEVFGATNVSKVLKELEPSQREAAANSLAYEAEHLLRDPVHGYLRQIYSLKQKINQVHADMENTKKELAAYIGPSAYQPMLLSQPQQHLVIPAQEQEITAIGRGCGSNDASDQHQHEHDRLDPLFLQQLQHLQDYFEAQQLAQMHDFIPANVISLRKGRQMYR